MPTLLHLDSSAASETSRSRAVTAAFAAAWRERGPEYTVVRRDLHAVPLPHLADASLHWPERLREPGAGFFPEAEALQAQLVAELLAADVLLVGAPMYNYSLPSTLKAWIDHVHLPGVLAPLDGSPQPLAGRPAVVVSSRGGIYDPGSAQDGYDHVVPVLSIILGDAFGMKVEIITMSRTLAGTLPALDGERERAGAELEAARLRAVALARSL